jgi:hypothetical protein
VIPSTLLGIIIFAASVGPGYLYVSIVDRYRPPVERTALRETAELVVIGALATTLGVAVALVLGDVTALLNNNKLAKMPGRYLVTEPLRGSGAMLVVLLISYGVAGVLSLWPNRGKNRVFSDSAWWGTFERDLPDGHGLYTTVELKDGRTVTGAVRSFTAEAVSVEDREIVLAAPSNRPLLVRTPTGATSPLRESFVLLHGSDIAYIAGSYLPLSP